MSSREQSEHKIELPSQPIPQLSTDKARAFEIFKRGYPSGEWIDNQKGILKGKYTTAKKLGETAYQLRLKMSMFYSH
jgi:hypothetical protein